MIQMIRNPIFLMLCSRMFPVAMAIMVFFFLLKVFDLTSFFIVKSWDGGISNLNRSLSEDKKSSFLDFDDEYNEEFDQGKVC